MEQAGLSQIQWSPSNLDTLGPSACGQIIEYVTANEPVNCKYILFRLVVEIFASQRYIQFSEYEEDITLKC